jgi:hypothetical protein
MTTLKAHKLKTAFCSRWSNRNADPEVESPIKNNLSRKLSGLGMITQIYRIRV